MMSILTKIAIFFLTLFFGLTAAVLPRLFVVLFFQPVDIEVSDINEKGEPTIASPPSGIRILYNGMRPTELRFVIVNGSSQPIICRGYEGKCESPEIHVRGREADAWVCMNGSSLYTIHPGQSAELIVHPWDFSILPGKTEQVSFGHPIDSRKYDSISYFGEPIVLPAEFRNSVREHLANADSF